MRDTMWVVIANASTARIFAKKKGNHKLNLIKELEHPESRKKVRELISDGAGRYNSRGEMVHGAYSRRTNPKEVEADHFANELAKFLDHARSTNDFTKVLLVMPAPFQGMVKHHISSQLLSKISGTISKDYHAATAKQLETLLS